jgi:ribosomal protein S12 methylthiotransferase accessory factor
MNVGDLLCFKPHFNVEIVDSEQVVLFSEDKQHLLKGFIYAAIAEILKVNPVSEKTIFDNLLKKFSFECIQEALTRLKSKKFITKHEEMVQKNIKAFWSDLALDSEDIAQKSIIIQNFSRHSSSDILEAMNSLSLSVNDSGNFFIVIVDNYICKELEDFNKERLKDGKPWMLFKPSGRVIWIGPIFESNRTGCWECLAKNLKENRRVEVDLFGLQNSALNIKSLPCIQTTYNIAINLAATEIAKWTKSKKSHRLNHHLLTFDLKDLEMILHPFKPKFSCTCQANYKSIKLQAPKLNPCLKKYYFEEGERSRSLDETLQNFQDILSPVTGIISTIRHSMVNDEHICYTVRTLPAPSELDFIDTDRYIRTPDVATGKGKTKLQATVGCIAEAVERYNCTFSTQTEIRCKYDDIKLEAIHPNELLNFSEMQYNNREIINTDRLSFNQIPCPYDNSKIGWTSVYSMTHDRFRYIPSSYCYLYYPFDNDVEMCPGNSNGCASGNSLEEATYYAFLELVERDAVAIWWYNRIKRPCIDLQSLNDRSLNQIQTKFKNNNRELYVLDLTTDLQIPCYVAVSWKFDGTEIFFGTAAHLQPQIGIARAISELNQVMIRANTPKNIDLMSISSTERDLVKWSITEKIENHPYFVPEGVCFPTMLHPNSADFLSDINLCLKIFEQKGLEVFLIDLTNPDIRFNTARVIIPGLRHFWSRLGQGRLYDVPVSLGWLKNPLSESEINPIPYFL